MVRINRFLTILLLAALLVSACQPIVAQSLAQPAAQTAEDMDNLEVARRYMEELWNEGKLEVYDELIAPDFVDLAPRPGFGSDREAFRTDLEGFLQDFPNQMAQFTIDEMITDGEWVALRGDFVVAPPDAPEPATTDYAVMLRIEDGLIRERWGVFNELKLMTGMGFTLTPPEAVAAPEIELPEGGAIAQINDIAMYYEIHGEGEPLLLIHSVAASSAQLAKVIPILAEEYQVIAVDFRGHGRTTDSGQPLSYELMASDMVALLDQLDIGAVHIVGNKDGGIIGLQMAMAYPERVKSLVAASANWSPAGFQPWFVDYLQGITLADWDVMVGEMYRTAAPDPSIMAVMLEKDRHMLLTQPTFTLEQLSTISAPVLVLAGADEEVLEIPHVAEMAAAIPNAELVLIDAGGHGVLDEQFEAWMEAVQKFLTERADAAVGYAHPEALVSTEWLAHHLSDPTLRILDTRDFLAEEDAAVRLATYEAGHIPGAVYVDAANDISDPNGSAPLLIIPQDGFEAQMGRLGIGNDTTVVAYDEGGNIWSARLWWALRYYGHDNVKLLNGGLAKWKAEGRALETGTNTPEPATFTAATRPELLATKADVKLAMEEPAVTIIDSLPPEFYSGEQGWPDLRVGHIPTALNLFVVDNLSPVDQTVLPMSELIALWQTVGLTPEDAVITYCGAGYAGAMNLFVLYQMGYENISLYDGSWMEWGADLTLPVEVTTSQ